MRSSVPKHLHPLLGRPLLDWVFRAAAALEPARTVVVVSPETRGPIEAARREGVELALQREPRGTGDAVATAGSALRGFEGDVLVLDGAAPLLTVDALEGLVREHRAEEAAVTVLAIEPDEPLPYGLRSSRKATRRPRSGPSASSTRRSTSSPLAASGRRSSASPATTSSASSI
jgi:bifunctional UDP-N-acetylglucosamine pyrophosphorylase / glucosamine-1-phosphate N-acetyltransferase